MSILQQKLTKKLNKSIQLIQNMILASSSPDLCKVALGQRKHAQKKVNTAEKGNLTTNFAIL